MTSAVLRTVRVSAPWSRSPWRVVALSFLAVVMMRAFSSRHGFDSWQSTSGDCGSPCTAKPPPGKSCPVAARSKPRRPPATPTPTPPPRLLAPGSNVWFGSLVPTRSPIADGESVGGLRWLATQVVVLWQRRFLRACKGCRRRTLTGGKPVPGKRRAASSSPGCRRRGARDDLPGYTHPKPSWSTGG